MIDTTSISGATTRRVRLDRRVDGRAAPRLPAARRCEREMAAARRAWLDRGPGPADASKKRAGCSSSPIAIRSSPAWSDGWISRRPAWTQELERLSRHPRLVGLRHIVQGEPDGFLERPAFRPRRRVPRTARPDLRHPGVRATAAGGGRRSPARFRGSASSSITWASRTSAGTATRAWRRHFDELAELPNVCCKLSGLVTEADWRAWTPAELRPYLDAALESFGPSRLMIGSDWPVCLVAASYGDVIGLVRDAIGEYSADEQEQMLGGTARDFFHLGARMPVRLEARDCTGLRSTSSRHE